jgi:hypothetical protein
MSVALVVVCAIALGLALALIEVARGGMRALAEVEVSHRHEVYELIEAQRREREQLLTRIQDPMLGSANHAQEVNGEMESTRVVPIRTGNREPSIDEQERARKVAKINAELEARGINPDTLPG